MTKREQTNFLPVVQFKRSMARSKEIKFDMFFILLIIILNFNFFDDILFSLQLSNYVVDESNFKFYDENHQKKTINKLFL
jgi:hypothetical protein